MKKVRVTTYEMYLAFFENIFVILVCQLDYQDTGERLSNRILSPSKHSKSKQKYETNSHEFQP